MLQNGRFTPLKVPDLLFLSYFYTFKNYRVMRQALFLNLVTISVTLLFTLTAYGQNRDPRVEELIKEGVELHDEGEYEEAIDRYLEALQLDSTSVLANYELSLSYLALRDFENALEYSSCDRFVQRATLFRRIRREERGVGGIEPRGRGNRIAQRGIRKTWG